MSPDTKVTGAPPYLEIATGLKCRKAPRPLPLDTVDAVIFDIDGVLVDVSGSFRQVISLAVQHYFNCILDIPGEERLIVTEETGLFKLAGSFNNDWDLTCGDVAYGLLKLANLDGRNQKNIAFIRSTPPDLAEFTGEIKKRGGGLEVTLKLVREKLSASAYKKFSAAYKPDLVRRIFMEHYAGAGHCRSFYGFDPRYYTGPGLIKNESFLLDPLLAEACAESGISFGVLSGRTPEEAAHFFRETGLDDFFDPRFVVLDDGSLTGKPDPAGLHLLARRMGFSRAVYVGDVPDDWKTVESYNSGLEKEAPVLGCLVDTGEACTGFAYAFQEELKVDYLATDVNCLLKALKRSA